MFEAREFLRKKLIGKKVNVVVDYIQTAKDNFPEKVCCTVTIGGVWVFKINLGLFKKFYLNSHNKLYIVWNIQLPVSVSQCRHFQVVVVHYV